MPDDLRDSLARLLDLTGGALAVVSGRPIRDIDANLRRSSCRWSAAMAPRCACATTRSSARSRRCRTTCGAGWRRRKQFDPGILIEDKGYSVALHYRRAPAMEARLRAHIEAVCADFPDEPMEMLPGKALFEIKRPGVSKGEGVRALLTHAPFAGRTPVFIGDDETDKTLFALLPEFGGIGFSVDLDYEGLAGIFASPAAVRGALQRLAQSAAARSMNASCRLRQIKAALARFIDVAS